MITFYRGRYSDLVIGIRSSEELGIIDTGYIEDYYGSDGFVSAFHLLSGVRYTIPVSEVPGETPAVPHDFFRGTIGLSNIPDGEYELQYRLKDIDGNWIMSGRVQTPNGLEKVVTLRFYIQSGFTTLHVVPTSSLVVRGALRVRCKRTSKTIEAQRVENQIRARRSDLVITIPL